MLQLQRHWDRAQRAALNITLGSVPYLPDEGISECQGCVAAKITHCKVHFSVKEPRWKFINNNLHLEESLSSENLSDFQLLVKDEKVSRLKGPYFLKWRMPGERGSTTVPV